MPRLRLRVATLTALALLPLPVLAQPCVGPAFDQPLPGSTGAEQRHADVPSARYPGLWQEGRVAGFTYRLFMDLTAVLDDGRDSPDWQVSVTCDSAAARCDEGYQGLAPIAATRVAEGLGRCLLGQTVTAEDFAPPEGELPVSGLPAEAGVGLVQDRPVNPNAGLAAAAGIETPPPAPATPSAPGDPDAPPRPLAFDAPAPAQPTERDGNRLGPNLAPPVTCGLGAVDAGSSPVMTLQRLLAEGGFAPGSDDGIMGPQTRRALARALGGEMIGQPVGEMIAALDQMLCAPDAPEAEASADSQR